MTAKLASNLQSAHMAAAFQLQSVCVHLLAKLYVVVAGVEAWLSQVRQVVQLGKLHQQAMLLLSKEHLHLAALGEARPLLLLLLCVEDPLTSCSMQSRQDKAQIVACNHARMRHR